MNKDIPEQTSDWFDFIKECMGYSFISRKTGKRVDKYLVYEQLRSNGKDVHRVATGVDADDFSRVNSEGWSDGKVTHTWIIDSVTKQVRLEQL